MAIINTLKMTFLTANATKTVSLKYVNPNVTSANVKTLMNRFINAGQYFTNHYLGAKSAKLVQTDTTEIDVS